MFCAKCGSWNIKTDIFCSSCWIKPQIYKRKISLQIDHYYLYPWSEYTRLLVYSCKNGFHLKTLEKIATQTMFPKAFFKTESRVVCAPSSTGKRFKKNHAWCIATAFGFQNIEDCFVKKGKQKNKSKNERKEIALSLQQELQGENWVFIDDVVTTGATVRAMYKALGLKSTVVFSISYVPEKSL